MATLRNLGRWLRRRWRPARDGQRGQAFVEFAITVMLFYTLIFGVTEGSRMVFQYSIVAEAARRGVRYAAVRGAQSGRAVSASDIQNYVASQGQAVITAGNVTVTWVPATCVPATAGACANKPGSSVQVQVQHTFTTNIPLVPFASVPLSSTSRMIISR